MPTITVSQLESHLWEAANILRGTVDAADFKSYVFPLLFFKRLFDVHNEEHAAALKEFDGDEEAALFPENYRFQSPEKCHWRDVRKVATNVGQTLQAALCGIEFYTPHSVVRLMVDISDPSESESIYDPTCGTGGMLLEAIHHAQETGERCPHALGQALRSGEKSDYFCYRLHEPPPTQRGRLPDRARRYPAQPRPLLRRQPRHLRLRHRHSAFSLGKWGDEAWPRNSYGSNFAGMLPAKSAAFREQRQQISEVAR